MCAEGRTPVLLRHPAVNSDRTVRLSLFSPALFNLSWICTVTQRVPSAFWDAENANGERSKDSIPEWSFLAQPGKASNLQGRLGGESMEKARGIWNTCHTYMDTGWSHTFQSFQSSLHCHTPSLSKSIKSSQHQNSRGSLIPGLGKP